MPEFHRFADFFPIMTSSEYDSLVDSIRLNGLREPIMLYEGLILDGRNRDNACQDAGIDPRYVQFEGNDTEALLFVWDENNNRRHMLAQQRAASFFLFSNELNELISTLSKKAEHRMLAGKMLDPTLNLAEGGEVRDKLSSLAGVGHTTLRDVQLVLEDDNEGRDTVEAICHGEQKLRDVQRRVRKRQQEETTLIFPEGTFRVLYADPPWKYSDSREELEGYGAAEDHYPTMTLQELKDLPVGNLVDKDQGGVLFLWATSPMLLDAVELLKFWGFTYKASQVWDKGRLFFGNYGGVQHEFLLIGTVGSCIANTETLTPSVWSIPRSKEHSEKPEQFRENIEHLYPRGPYLELFSRGYLPENWNSWGASE